MKTPLTRLFLLIFYLTTIHGITVNLIENARLNLVINETISIDNSTVNKCLCIMLNSTNIFSMNYYSNNKTCELFLIKYFNFDEIKINFNSTFYFREALQFTTELPESTTIMPETEMTTSEIQTISNCPSSSVLSSIQNVNNRWVYIGNMSKPRFGHTSTFIVENDGTSSVLLAGGGIDINGTPTTSTEKYLVASSCFISTKEMDFRRRDHTADRLSSSNPTILIGGGDDGSCSLSIATFYASSTHIRMSTSRSMHTSTILSGNIIFIGGIDFNGSSSNTGDVFNGYSFVPVANNMSRVRIFHTATAIPNANLVLITGGSNDNTAEIYNGTPNTFVSSSILLLMSSIRLKHTATYLPPPIDMIMIAGGGERSFDLFIPTNLSFSRYGGQMIIDRSEHTATLLSDGHVLLVGGRSTTTTEALFSCEIYNPIFHSFSLGSSLNIARYGHTATLIEPDNQTLLVCGGQDSNTLPLNSCELYIL